MFEAEMEMEKRSPILPMILMMSFVLVILGGISGIVYMVIEAKKGLSPADASQVLIAALKEQGPATVAFASGYVKPSVSEHPADPHYRLLEKAGLVTLRPDKKTGAVQVTVTSAGETLFSRIPALRQVKNADGTQTYIAPLAERRFGEVTKVTMNGPNSARVEYTWKWVPNQLGETFDAASAAVKSFNTWDRATLISKYGVDFYHGDAKREATLLVRKDGQWTVATE